MGRRWRGGGRKPRDVGTGLVCASFGERGGWLSLATAHPSHGFVELSAAPVFDERRRGQPDYVRAHRAALADGATAFLAPVAVPGTRITSRVRARQGATVISQRLRVQRSSASHQPRTVSLVFRGRLDRPPLAMITEVGSRPPPTGAVTRLEATGPTLHVIADELRTRVAIRVAVDGAGAAWRVSGSEASLRIPWPAGTDTLVARVTCEVSAPSPVAQDLPPPRDQGRDHQSVGIADGPGLVLPPAMQPDIEVIRRRALRYVRGCTALRAGPARVVILTDHRLLPLSWTRDAYYQALLLLRSGDFQTVADHLRWLWLSCDRPTGTWARSHHANGARKDEVYQADQQLYPLLELADYRWATGTLPELDEAGSGGRDWPSLVAEVVDDISRRMSSDGLIATDESAADDPADLPYLLANQILAWYTLTRVVGLSDQLGIAHPLTELAQQLRDQVRRMFRTIGPEGELWAYAVDGRGSVLLHHDANDLATALAPLWGFCSADDPLWRRTMDFAFSPANDAFVAGRYGGLGSCHTPGVWSLGLIQEWVARSLIDAPEAAEDALRRLLACSMSDGTLPEASDPASGRLLARHWFAWPGAFLGGLLPARSVARRGSARLHSRHTAHSQSG